MTATRTPPVDPRIKVRRQEVTRQAGRRRLRYVLGALVLVVLVVAGWFVVHSGLLSARVVTVTGASHTPRAAVVAAAGLSDHPPLINVDTTAAAARIDRLPWVASASVRRDWPDGVHITVVERVPVAVVAAATPAAPAARSAAAPAGTAPAGTAPAGTAPAAPGTTAAAPAWAEVDRTGRVVVLAASPPPGLVTVHAPAAAGPPGSTLPSVDDPALAVAASLPPAFSAQVAAVVGVAGGAVTLQLTTPITVNLGDTSQLTQKYEDVASILHGAPLTAGDVIDVAVPDSPTVGQG